MNTTFSSLTISSPHSPNPGRIRISGKAGLIFVVAFVLAFFTTVALLLMFPRVRVNGSDHVRFVEVHSQQVAALMPTN